MLNSIYMKFFLKLLPASILVLGNASDVYAIDIRNVYPLAQDSRTLGFYLSPLVSTAVLGAGLVALLLVIGGGLAMIIGAGNPQSQEKGRNAVSAGVLGFILVVSAYWIVQILEILFGVDLLNPGI